MIDWASWGLTADIAGFSSPYWFASGRGKTRWATGNAFATQSRRQCEDLTIVVVGSEDYRTPDSEAEQFYEALQLRSIPTMLVKVPGAGHESLTDRPSQSAAKASAILAWFDRYRTHKSSAAIAEAK